MTAPAATAAPDIRRNTSAEAKGQTEHLIRIAHVVLANVGYQMAAHRVTKRVRQFEREVAGNGWSFLDYLATSIAIDAERRVQLLNNPDVQRVIAYADPTGETAVGNVKRERGY